MRKKHIQYNVNIYLSGTKDNNIISTKLNGKELEILKTSFNDKKVVDCNGYIIDLGKVLYINYREN